MSEKTNQSVLQSVKAQLAKEYGCESDVFDREDHTIVMTEDDDHFFKIITFGMGSVIQANKKIHQWCMENLTGKESKDILDGPIIFGIEKRLRDYGKQLDVLQNRYLFSPNQIKREHHTNFKIRWYEREEIPALYEDKRFKNALSYKEKHDVLAVAALEGDHIVALAGADDFKGKMWQIGIDTMPSHRKKGAATYLVHLLATEINRRGFIPYYTTWSANLASTKAALNSGFFPAWIECFAVDAG